MDVAPFQLFSETFMEDPLFVCTFGQSQMSAINPIEKKRTVNAEKESTIQSWCKLLQVEIYYYV